MLCFNIIICIIQKLFNFIRIIINKMFCGRGCNDSFDVRCCCESNCQQKNTITQFNKCSQKISTLYFHIGNNYNVYSFLENRNNILNKKMYCQFKIAFFRTNLHELVNDIYIFLEDGCYLGNNDIRRAKNKISRSIHLTDNECCEIIELINNDIYN